MIHVMPNLVDYGTIPVLTDVSKAVKLSNESLIPAQFSCTMVSYVLTWFTLTNTLSFPLELDKNFK